MLVRDDARLDRLGFDAHGVEPFLEDPRPEPGLDQNARVPALQENGVPPAATAEHPELHRVRSATLQRRANAAASSFSCRSDSSTCLRNITFRATSMNLSMR